jgi:hypothetical protein
MSPIIKVSAVNYPESDGRPMGETDEHRDAMIRHIDLLRACFRGHRVYVSGDLLVYYEQGNPKKFVVPDAFVVKGIDPKKRRIYKIWVEGKAPDVVIETTSRKTKRKDTEFKPKLFARLGVKEYFVFDPLSEYLDPNLQGFRLVRGKFEPIKPDEQGALSSRELGVRLQSAAGRLEFYRSDTGKRLLTPEEERDAAEAARRAEAEARRAEAKSRRAIESELARLRKELRQRNTGQ